MSEEMVANDSEIVLDLGDIEAPRTTQTVHSAPKKD